MEKVSLKSKINVIRLELSKEMNKSGKNTYSKYDYFQLKDFMPKAIALMNEHGVYAEFNMYKKKFDMPNSVEIRRTFDPETGVLNGEVEITQTNFEYREVATLDVYNLDNEEDTIHLEKDTANVSLQAAQPIQNLGGKNTYMKRYMYMDLFEINENDAVEAETGKPAKVETKTTKATTKPKTVAVDTNADVSPADFEPVVKGCPTGEPGEQATTDGMMSMARKVELANYIKSKGGVPKDVMAEVTATLGLETATLKESDYDNIKNEIDKKLGGN